MTSSPPNGAGEPSEGEPSPGNGAARLRDILFSDLYIPVDPAEDSGHARLLKAPRRGGDRRPPSLVLPLPARFDHDVDRLRNALAVEYARSRRDEFAHVHDGVRYRCARIPDEAANDWWCLRRPVSAIPRFDELGLPAEMAGRIMDTARGSGLFIIAGPTRSGKTTLAASLIAEVTELDGDVTVTVEDPPEVPIKGRWGSSGLCFQVPVRDDNWEAPLRRALRWAPRRLLIGEIRSREAAQQALRYSMDGHFVVTTLHSSSIETALLSFLSMLQTEQVGFARQRLAEGLAGVLHLQLLGVPPRLMARALFLGAKTSDSARGLIRAGEIEQLNGLISAQAAQRWREALP